MDSRSGVDEEYLIVMTIHSQHSTNLNPRLLNTDIIYITQYCSVDLFKLIIITISIYIMLGNLK